MADESSFLVPILREMVYGVDAWKKPVKVVATSNITLHGLQTVDGVALAAGDEVLCVGQTSGAQNGVWVAAVGAWTRRFDATTSERLFEGVRVPVTRGTAGARRVYRLATTGKINVGITAQTWELDGGDDDGSPEDVDATADTLLLRGSSGEARAVRVELSGARLLPGAPTQPGDLGFDANSRAQAWRPGFGAANVLLAGELYYVAHWEQEALSAGVNAEKVIGAVWAAQPMRVVEVMFFPLGNFSDFDNTDYVTLKVRSAASGFGTDITSWGTTIGSDAWVQHTPVAIPIDINTQTAGDALFGTVEHSGAGKDIPAFSVFVKLIADPDYGV